MEALLDEISGTFESSSLQRLRPAILDLKEKLRADEVRLAVLGQMKRGKSSLLNALLGERILPTGVLPLTSVVTEIRYGAVPKANVHYQRGSVVEEIALSEIVEYVTEARNPGNRKGVGSLQLFYPSQLLQDGLVLVDTPGFGSTYSHNTLATLGYLSRVDAAIIVFSIDPPITEVEANFIRDIQKDIPRLMFILNKVDLVSDDEAQAACTFLRDELKNRLGLVDFDVFPLTTRFYEEAIESSKPSTGLCRFEQHLRHFAKYGHDATLFMSILRDAGQALNIASFALSLSERFSAVTAVEIEDKRMQIRQLLNETERETVAIRALLREERLSLMKKIGIDLDMHVKTSTPYLEERLLSLKQANPHSSGRALGRLLEEFFNKEVAIIFRDWRMQEDAQVSMLLEEIVSRYTEKANSILNRLFVGMSSLVDLPPTKLQVHCGLAMDSRVSYSVERIFISLDGLLLALPPFLQRPVVFRRAMTSVPDRLDRNSGRIRFDYLERMERSFQVLERSLTSQIEDARQTLVKMLETPDTDVQLRRKIEALQSCVSALT